MKQLLIILLLLLQITSFAQIEKPFYCKNGCPLLKTINEGRYYSVNNDSISYLVFIGNDSTYKLLNTNNKIIVTGELSYHYLKKLRRTGLWTEYYPNGIIKKTGQYYEDEPIGMWTSYYPNGNKKEVYTLSMLEYSEPRNTARSGLSEMYYPNGKFKSKVLYGIEISKCYDTVTKEVTNPSERSWQIVERDCVKSVILKRDSL